MLASTQNHVSPTLFSSTGVLVYDYILTLGQELQLFWKRKLTGATVLFLINRYLFLFYIIISMCSYFRMSDRASTPRFSTAHLALISLCFYNRRTYAFYPLEKRRLTFVAFIRCSGSFYLENVLTLAVYLPQSGKHMLQVFVLDENKDLQHSPPAFSALRVFALSQGNWFLLVLTLVLGLFPLVTGLVIRPHSLHSYSMSTEY